MLKLFCLITGDDYNIVKQETPASRKKISVLASILFIPVILWFVIGFSIGDTIFKLIPNHSLLIGVITGTIIFIIERAIIMAGSSKILACIRIFMGVLIALLGSFFLDEIIFKADIDQQVFLDRNEVIDSEKARIHMQYDASIIEAKSRVSYTYQQWLSALAEAKQESDGSGGSGVRGLHQIAKLKLAISDQHGTNYQAANTELSLLTQQLADKLATTEITTKQLITGESILFRVKSLFRLVSSDTWVLVIYSLFTALLFFFEFVVVLMKHALPKTNYERRLSAMEVVGKRRLAAITDRDAQLFEPSETSEPVMYTERLLQRTIPSRFRAS